MLSIRHQRKGLAILTTNSLAMCYGAAVAGGIAYFFGDSFVLPMKPVYLSALFYLALFGSVIGFGALLSFSWDGLGCRTSSLYDSTVSISRTRDINPFCKVTSGICMQ